MDKCVDELLDSINYGSCAVIFFDKDMKDKSIVACKHAAVSFIWSDFVSGKYDNYEEYKKSYPVDDRILYQMMEYEMQVFWMMERGQGGSFEQRWRNYYCKHVRFWNYVLDSMKIDVVISPVVSHEIVDYIIYVLCKAKKIKYISALPLPYYNRFYAVTDIYNQLPDFREEYKDIQKKYANIALEKIVLNKCMEEVYNFYTTDQDLTPYYMKDRPVLKKTSKCEDVVYRIFHILKSVRHLFDFSSKCYRAFANNSCKTKYFCEDNILFDFYRKHCSNVDYNKKYIYVPLHMQPELTSSPLGGIYVDQLLMVEMLSYWLPEDWIIYVKEHKYQTMDVDMYKMAFFRSMDFYEDMLGLSNVKFVSLEEDTYKLIKNSQAVATLTGTAGLEAVALGKPFLMFGYYYMNYCPNVYNIRNNEDCKNAIKAITNWQIDSNFQRNFKLFFKTLETYVYETTTEYRGLKESDIYNAGKEMTRMFFNEMIRVFGDAVAKK